MNWLLESPVTILVLGVISVAVLLYVWTQLQRRSLLVAAAVVLVVVAGLMLLELMVQTDAEQVEATLREIAADVERNDLPAALAHFHSTAQSARLMASGEMPKYEFAEVKVKSVEVMVDPDHQPPKAVAKFNVVVVGSDRDQLIGRRHVPRYCEVTFLKENGHWRVSDYLHREPTFGLRQ